jgi:hypothetical protein
MSLPAPVRFLAAIACLVEPAIGTPNAYAAFLKADREWTAVLIEAHCNPR